MFDILCFHRRCTSSKKSKKAAMKPRPLTIPNTGLHISTMCFDVATLSQP